MLARDAVEIALFSFCASNRVNRFLCAKVENAVFLQCFGSIVADADKSAFWMILCWRWKKL